MSTDLSNYFNDWIHIGLILGEQSPPNGKAYTGVYYSEMVAEVDLWCYQNCGVRGGLWDRYHKPAIPSDKKTTRGAVLRQVWRFKDHSHGMLFLLRWGGEVITNQ